MRLMPGRIISSVTQNLWLKEQKLKDRRIYNIYADNSKSQNRSYVKALLV